MSRVEAARSLPSASESAPPPAEQLRPSLNDPLAPILALGRKELRTAAIIGVLGTCIVHAAPASRALLTFQELSNFSSQVLEVVQERLRSEVDIEVEKLPPPPPPPPPAPEPEPEPERAPPPRAEPNNEPPPPPAPAEAAKILTSEPDPEEPVDLTDQGFVTGNADRFPGGITANTGTSTRTVRDINATLGGVPGGTGPKTSTPPPARDLSRPAMPAGGSWDCGFPAEADMEGINRAVVTLAVTVGPDGRAKSVTVLQDPGNGFGKLARSCATRKAYTPALDRYGKPLVQTTPPFTVRFTR